MTTPQDPRQGAPATTAIARVEGRVDIPMPKKVDPATFGTTLADWGAELTRLASPRFDRAAERLAAGFQQAILTTPALLECTPKSIFLALAKCARLGLDVGESGIYLVPNTRSIKTRDGKSFDVQSCEAWVDYRGLKVLARRARIVRDMREFVVYEGDDFAYELGTQAFLRHKPVAAALRGPITHAYVLVDRPGLPTIFHVMPIEDIEKIRAKSRGWNDEALRKRKEPTGPLAWYCKKTVDKDYLNRQPKTDELAEALLSDDVETPAPVISAPAPEPDDAMPVPVAVEETGQAATDQQTKQLVQLLGDPLITDDERADYFERAEVCTVVQMEALLDEIDRVLWARRGPPPRAA